MNSHGNEEVEATLLIRKVEKQMKLLDEARGVRRKIDWTLGLMALLWVAVGWLIWQTEADFIKSHMSAVMIFLAFFNVHTLLQDQRFKQLELRIDALIELLGDEKLIGARHDDASIKTSNKLLQS